ncbi:PAS domain S-box protein [candidate division KSB1 bacterium]
MSKPTYEELEHQIKELKRARVHWENPDQGSKQIEEMFGFLADNVSDIIWMMDMDLKVVYINKAVEKLRGFTVEEVMEQSLSEILSPDSEKIASEILNKYISEIMNGDIPDVVVFDLEFKCRDGSTIWGESNISVKFENDRPIAIFGITRDITAYREAKETLMKQEELYRRAIHAANAVSYYHNIIEKKYEFIDDNIFELTGFSKEEFTPGIWDSLITESLFFGEFKGMSYREVKDLVESKGEITFWKSEYKIIKRDGTERWISDSSVMIYDKKGSVVASLGILQDINERKLADEAVESERNLLKTLIEELPAAVSVKDLHGKIILANQQTVQNFKVSGINEVIGKSDFDLLPKHIARNYYAEEKEIIRTGIPIHHQIVTSADKKLWSSVSKLPLRNKKGEITNILVINYDITNMKLAEIENRNLERQLFQSQKMESIGRLAGGLAHDFNNILAGILGYSELLKIQFENTSTSAEKAVEVIYEGALKASRLTKQLLNFAREEQHSTISIYVNTVIENVLKISENIFEGKISLKKIYGVDLKPVEANAVQLDQVFTNLIINSNDAMPDGGELIIKTENVFLNKKDVKTLPDLDPGNYVRITFEDTGTGIPEEFKSKVFEPFFTTKSSDKGTGLGLATVYAIIKNHKGHVNLNSEEGKGTVFTILLPASGKKPENREEYLPLVKGKGMILVVDDEESIVNLLNKELEFLGYNTISATSGQMAVDIFKERKDEIDLVILDIIMPEMDGNEAFKLLAEIDPDIKVIISSGYSKERKAEKLLEGGAVAFIQKPFRMNELSTVLKTSLNINKNGIKDIL